MLMKKIALLGATGSIGQQVLDVTKRFPNKFKIEVMSAAGNFKLLAEEAAFFRPGTLLITNTQKVDELKQHLTYAPEVLGGSCFLEEIVTRPEIDLVIIAISGFEGFFPALKALECGKTLLLANKESLVVGGDFIMKSARLGENLIPIDSEHMAILQCLARKPKETIEEIILTASGGPFYFWQKEEFKSITPQMALRHPTWKMGKKITIDSATLMNKGLEVIEAHWFFGVEYEKIKVLIHPKSLVHSLVQFQDGSLLAQLGPNDMRIPIQSALTWPEICFNPVSRLNLATKSLSFYEPDFSKFPCLGLAYRAGKKRGNYPLILNAANEIAVDSFLNSEIGFEEIPIVIEKAFEEMGEEKQLKLEELKVMNAEIKEKTKEIINRLKGVKN